MGNMNRDTWRVLLGAAVLFAAVLGCGSPESGERADQASDRARLQEDLVPEVPELADSGETDLASVRVPAGTVVRSRIEEDVSTQSKRAGDTFTLVATERVILDGHVVITPGARLEARVLQVKPATGVPGVARLAFQVVTLQTEGGNTVTCVTQPARFKGLLPSEPVLASRDHTQLREDTSPGLPTHDDAVQVDLVGYDIVLRQGTIVDVVLISPLEVRVPWGTL
ncbi:MAG: hypothetical protein ACE5G2_07505 [Candidatus Krumholzibacteriia bacterium]